MTLPARSAVLNEVYKAGSISVNQTMQNLKPIYGMERQFQKKLFIEHFMSLEAVDLIVLDKYELDNEGELNLYYTITETGKEITEKYIPKQYH
ncbi:hypothetical protein SAMN05421767_11825 [Granulicatella balaenopterae]|uniref:Uncharacterized protein n=1 Tax=Granulicatella balaenopterae TaxID=137733 RepID=A0A1H9LC55_9LACT|nr:hypothetical protein [Granulicatella balaenopterae]SER08553.1 hypothetical protein SAMN05421767_11825 [Granulicatella balaenopterae]